MIANLAESWRDRESGLATELQNAAQKEPSASKKSRKLKLEENACVTHERFGEGVITQLSGKGEDATVTILFDGEQERTFLLSLVQDKLS
jgi:hypothetical protein